ncbi:MAG TPA: PEP-CTERM sorting domain-containing protein [Stellaceae bacterium]|nr:PEP-CTERM sorting domain-containing protein [Stellaceae bacterium]
MELSAKIPAFAVMIAASALLLAGGSALAGAGNGCTVLVSEPTSLALFMGGVGALAYLRHRKGRNGRKR